MVMKKILLTIVLLQSLTFLFSQSAYYTNLLSQLQNSYNLAGGSWIQATSESTVLSGAINYGTTATTVNVSNQPFTQAAQLVIGAAGSNPWDAGHQYKNNTTINSGDVLLMSLWLRCTAPGGRVNIFVENATTYEKEAFYTLYLSTAWQQYFIRFDANQTYTANDLSLGLHLAWQAQTIEVGGFACRNYQNAYALEALPQVLHNEFYPGYEADAAWRAPAEARIQQYRKADLFVSAIDLSGSPISGATVDIEMLQHDFAFGSAVTASRIAGNENQDNTYQDKILNLDGNGHGFNQVVFENDLKWPSWEGSWTVSHTGLVNAISWLRDHDITMRGHNLVWPFWQYMPADMETNQSNINYMKNRINGHLDELLNYPGIKGQLADWDVINEISESQDLVSAFQGNPGYPTGREIYKEIFNQAKVEDTTSILYLNEYVAVERGDTNNVAYQNMKTYLAELINSGAPVEGIGFQGHMGAFPTGIPMVYAILDDFYQDFGLPSKVTEYDMDEALPDSTAAKYLSDFLTIVFSHPSSRGFLMWGFWDGAHWHSNAPLFNEDWTLKPSGQAFIDKVFGDWWTVATQETNASGIATFNGFKGKYRIKTTSCGVTTVQTTGLLGELSVTVQQPSINGNFSVCNDGTYTYSIPATPNTTYQWNVSNGVIISGQGTAQIVVDWANTVTQGNVGVVRVVE